jgi:hypothetical protein
MRAIRLWLSGHANTLIADGDREPKTAAMLRPVAADYDQLADTLDKIASQTAAFAEPDSQPETRHKS